MKKIPVLVLTGFLGTGKTTYLNYLLSDRIKTAVIINEFGEEAIDPLLISQQKLPLTVLGGGCLCCQVKGVLTPTLKNLWLKWSTSVEEEPFDRVIIETSGIANPSSVVDSLLSDRWLSERYELIGIVALFSCVDGFENLRTFQEIHAQLIWADAVFLTHQESVQQSDLTALQQKMAEKFPAKEILMTSRSWEFLSCSLVSKIPKIYPLDQNQVHPFSSFSLMWKGYVSIDGLRCFLEQILKDESMQILRLKGLVYGIGEQSPFVIQGVTKQLFDILPFQGFVTPDLELQSRLVLICSECQKDKVKSALRELSFLGCQSLRIV